ncbi:heme oxygenase 1 [Ambystoma mexicanum]|uniref:heme oxygenase 1 n=1 Tax=Ambystoma mexicanum TaxID=8296 RepID=UPI0037E90C2F
MASPQSALSDGAPGELSEALKEATKEVHQQAEDTEFMRNFQKGQVSLNEFKLVMSSLYFVYEALEEEIERNKDHPGYAPVYFPTELHRKAALELDMAYFYGSQWRNVISCPKATRMYVARLHHVGQKEPELLVAHAYTRYLGDLSGGQVLKKIAQKALQLPASGEGLAFFTFDGVTSATKFKQLYRARMNAIEMDDSTKERVLNEAKKAFLLNVAVFEELQELVSSSAAMNGLLAQEKSEPHRRGPASIPNGHGSAASGSAETRAQSRALPPSTVPMRWVVVASLVLGALAFFMYAI